MSVNLFLYRHLFFPLLHAGAGLLAFGNTRVQDALNFRESWKQAFPDGYSPGEGVRVHFHVASAGEYEQARGIMDAVRAVEPAIIWTLSFSSISGMRQIGADQNDFELVTPLPLDYRTQIRHYLDKIRPDLVIFIRYDLWPLFVEVLHERGVAMLLACASRRQLPSFPTFRALAERTFSRMTHISAVNRDAADWYASFQGVQQVSVDGDSRLERVRQRVEHADLSYLERIRSWIGTRGCIVAGSTWGMDDEVLAGIPSDSPLCTILVPHVVSDKKIETLLELFPDAILISRLMEMAELTAPEISSTVLIVDCYGLLAELYAVGEVAWVGGGFGEGVHSVAEPAAHKIPVLSGPAIESSVDALSLRDAGGLLVAENGEEARETILAVFDSERLIEEVRSNVEGWLEEKTESSDRFARLVLDLLEDR